MKTLNRRNFLKSTALTVPAVMIVPRHVLGGVGFKAPSDTLNIGVIGAGGVGASYIKGCASQNIVTLCDVDDERAAETFKKYPKAPRYKDFRIMLEKEKGIDAVIVATPDHTHTTAGIAAMDLGKHLYLAKPLTRTIYECRKLTAKAKETGVATQMSTQQNASDDHRVLAEWLHDGAIGNVTEVHLWSNRPIWPQGIDRPTDTPPVPSTLDWDLWLGPAPQRPYHPAYVPFKFRGWLDFGTGALGDMGCHGFDPIMKALKLTQPTSVHASSTPMNTETFPSGSIIHYDFPEREGMPPLRLTWYDGGLMPPRPDELEDTEPLQFDWNGGTLYVGSKGKLMTDAVGNKPHLIPKRRMQDYEKPLPRLERSIGHYQEWIEACKGGKPAGAEFGYGGPVTEMVLLGNLALRKPGVKLYWDPEKMRITNDTDVNQYIQQPYYNGWTI